MLRRVRKEEVQREAFIQPDPLDKCLECWKGWMSGDADRDLGVKTMRARIPAQLDADEAQQARDNQIGEATDAMIDSLSRLHRWAIYDMCGVATLWKFPNADLLKVGPEAREALTEKLKKNCCTGILF